MVARGTSGALALAALAVLGSACADGPPDDISPGDAGPLPSADQLYSAERVWNLRIRLPDSSWDRLTREPREYVPATVYFEGRSWEDVGVRLKGAFSFQGLGGKAAFKIKFNQYDPSRRFLGLEGLTLNNMRQDRAFVHEWLAYRVFRAYGLPAPRSGYVRLTINGELFGLYANVESVDDVFLTRWFDDPDGNLYEATLRDLVPEDLWDFEQDEGGDLERADLAHLIDVVGEPTDEIFFGDDQLLDTEGFLGFVAAEVLTGHWDGYHKANNYRIYHEPTLDQWSFIPWGTDQTYEREVGALAGTGVLITKCFAEPSCLAAYAKVARELADVVDDLDLAAESDAIGELVAEAAEEDPRKPFVYDKYLRHRAETRALVAAWPDRLRAEMGCVGEDGAEVDRDGDGFGACFADCDDSSELARPGGVEVCDSLDNDCDGFVDELGECPCEEVEVGGGEFLLCVHPMLWNQARSHCETQGAVLAHFDDAAQNDALFAVAQQRVPGRWLIGLHDRSEEGEYAWASGAPMTFEHWAPGDPDDFGEEDCVVMDPFAGGAWTDQMCGVPAPYICRRLKEQQ